MNITKSLLQGCPRYPDAGRHNRPSGMHQDMYEIKCTSTLSRYFGAAMLTECSVMVRAPETVSSVVAYKNDGREKVGECRLRIFLNVPVPAREVGAPRHILAARLAGA